MPQAVLVIHGAGEPRLRDGRIYWEPLLQGGLGAEFRVRAPRMPEPEDPHYEPWAKRIAELLAGTERPILVGHSLGASILLKFLARADPLPAVRGLFLVATPLWNSDFEEFAFSKEDVARLQPLSPFVFYQSRDDDVVGFDHLSKFRRELPRATFRELDGRGHEFDQETFPELVADIRRCARESN
jgi:predicted alpha/beta hydrolase family esterase